MRSISAVDIGLHHTPAVAASPELRVAIPRAFRYPYRTTLEALAVDLLLIIRLVLRG